MEQFEKWVQSVDVTLGLDKETKHNENKVVELKVKAKRGTLFTKVQAKSFEKAVSEATEKMVRQTKKMMK